MSETYFIREKKERDYTVVDNTYIRDCDISWKAKGLFTYILSLPENWKIYMSELVNHSTGGREELKSIIKELINAGYIIRSKTQDKKGLFIGWSYNIIESPDCGINRERENRPSDIPTSENKPLLNTNLILNTNKQNKEVRIPSKQEIKKDDQFLIFYQNYPKKTNKTDASKAFSKLIKSGITLDFILSKLKVYEKQIAENKTETKYIRNPQRFLNTLDDFELPETKPEYKPVEKRCPKCGGEIKFGMCSSCGIIIGTDGKEIIL